MPVSILAGLRDTSSLYPRIRLFSALSFKDALTLHINGTKPNDSPIEWVGMDDWVAVIGLESDMGARCTLTFEYTTNVYLLLLPTIRLARAATPSLWTPPLFSQTPLFPSTIAINSSAIL